MGRKKQNIDPLGGPISGGYEVPKKKKSKGSPADILGGSRPSTEYKEEYNLDPYDGRGAPDKKTGKKEKSKKPGFFSTLFSGKKSKKQQAEEPELPPEQESWNEPEPITKPVPKQKPTRTPEPEITTPTGETEDLFEEETSTTPASPMTSTATETTVNEKPQTNICWICGKSSTGTYPYFTIHPGSTEEDNAFPLCKTCYRAVTTLMKYRDQADEQEILAEWKTICSGVNEHKADRLITEGRKYH